MNKLIALFFLAVFVAVGECQPDDAKKYLPTVQKYCKARFGPNGAAFKTCYDKEVQSNPDIQNDETLFAACANGQTATEDLIKRECNVLTGPSSPARDTLMQCLVDHVKSKVAATTVTFDQAITIGKNRVHTCIASLG